MTPQKDLLKTPNDRVNSELKRASFFCSVKETTSLVLGDATQHEESNAACSTPLKQPASLGFWVLQESFDVETSRVFVWGVQGFVTAVQLS